MKRNAMRRNLRQSIVRSIGRYIAIMLIIALGASIFVGLRMTKADMVATGQKYTDRQNMFDLRLASSYGWGEEQLQEIKEIARDVGIVDVEGVFYSDLISYGEDATEELVYRFYTLPESVNRVVLLNGRMPQAPNECLADGYQNDDSILGKQIHIASTNSEDTMDMLTVESFTVVGLVSTPLYMDMNRGNTTIGGGSVKNYFFAPREAFDVDYYTEIHVTIPGDHKIYSEEYNDAMDAMADKLEPLLEPVAEERFRQVLEEAKEAYEDGVWEYEDGLKEYEDGKAEAQKELADAEQELLDGEQELKDNEQKLIDGEKQIEEAWDLITEGEITLQESKKTLADGKAQAYEQIAEAQEELFENYQTVSSNLQQLDGGLLQISAGLIELNSGITQLESGLSQLDSGIDQLEMLIGIMDISIEAAEEALKMAEQFGSLGQDVVLPELPDMTETTEPSEEVTEPEEEETEPPVEETEPSGEEDALEQLRRRLQQLIDTRNEYQAQLDDLKSQREQYGAQLEELYATRTELETQQAELEANRVLLENALVTIEEGFKQLDNSKAQMEAKFASAEAQIESGEAQLEANKLELQRQETELADGWEQLEEGKKDLAEGWIEYEDGKKEVEQELAEAEAKLADAKVKLDDAKETIDGMTESSLHVLDRNTNVGYASLDSSSDIVEGISRVFPVFFLLVAALVCITTMTRMVDEERTQIGTLKAMGYSNGAIISKYLIYAGSSAIFGCGLGVLAGSVVFPMILWEAYKIMLFIQDAIVLTFDWGLCLAVVGAYTVVILLVTWYCCYRTLAEVPAELIRPKAPTAGKQLIFEKLPFWKNVSFLNKVTIRNIFRYRQRLAMMMVGIGGCTALLLTGFGLRDSIVNIVDFQFEEITMYDMEVYFNDEQDALQMEAFREELNSEAENVMFYHQSSVELDANNQIREIYMIAAGEEIRDFIDLHHDKQQLALPGDNEMLLSIGVAEAMGVQTGDVVTLRNPDMEELELTVSGIYYNHVYNYAILSPHTIELQWGRLPEQQMAFVRLRDGVDPHLVSADISSMDDVMNVSVSEDLAFMVRNMMDALDLVVWVIVFCAGLLAATVLYNLTNININERIREIATIKVLGFNAMETAMYIFKENLTLTVVGSLFGLLLGDALLNFVMSEVKINMVWFLSRALPMSFVLSVVMTILMAVIVDFIFYHKLEKINMAEALKSVE